MYADVFHHEGLIQMAIAAMTKASQSTTQDILPRLAKTEVKQMAEKMKADQHKEIAEFERKVKG